MNRELFISDFKQLSRMYGPDFLPRALADYVEQIPSNPRHATVEIVVDKDKVIGLCCEHFKTSLLDMVARDRTESIRYKRQIIIYLLRRRTRMSLDGIGRLFERDHSSVAHTCKRIRDLMSVDETVKQEIEQMNAQL